MKIKIRKKIILPLGTSLAMLFSGCGNQTVNTPDKISAAENAVSDVHSDEKFSDSLFAMDTYITVTAYGSSAEAGIAAAKDKITSLESLWSVTDENSDIYKVNHSGTADVAPVTTELINFALEMCRRTNGALDISLYPVLTAWGFTTGDYRVPSDREISELLKNTGIDNINIEGDTVSIPDGMMIDLGAVAKGWSGDAAAQALKDCGVTSALLDLGGNIQTVGDTKPDGSKWTIGIQNPFGEGSFGILEIGETAVITSGGYERFFIEDGIRYKHILDPETGKPAESGLESVTIVGSEGRLCDSLSTSLYVMGLEKAENFWRSSGDFEMILVDTQGVVYITEGLADSFQPIPETAKEVMVIQR